MNRPWLSQTTEASAGFLLAGQLGICGAAGAGAGAGCAAGFAAEGFLCRCVTACAGAGAGGAGVCAASAMLKRNGAAKSAADAERSAGRGRATAQGRLAMALPGDSGCCGTRDRIGIGSLRQNRAQLRADRRQFLGGFEKAIPQGLRPTRFIAFFGTTEVVPFHGPSKLFTLLPRSIAAHCTRLAVAGGRSQGRGKKRCLGQKG